MLAQMVLQMKNRYASGPFRESFDSKGMCQVNMS